MAAHALLSASSAYRWLACPPSARACENMEDTPSPYAKQGTDAHALCEYKVKKALGFDATDPTENLDWFDAEMDDCTDEYAEFVMEQLTLAKQYCSDPKVLVEERLDFSEWVPQGFGTGDAVVAADKVLHVIDFKYGVGVPVEAENNPQMRCYALGAISAYGCLYDIDTVKMTIFQPRLGNVSTAEMSRDELLSWAENILAPTAKLAYAGEGEFCAGSHCRFCKMKAVCRKRAEANTELAKYDFMPPDTLEDDEIAEILTKADELVSWAGDVKEYALRQALSGVKYAGFKVVEGRSNRKYSDDTAVAEAVKVAGYDPYEKKVLGLTAMTTMLGKRKFDELLSDLIVKPKGKPVLVPETDKREPMNTAIEDFNV